MTEDQILKLLHLNSRLTMLLGYSMHFAMNSKRETEEEKKKFEWFMRSVENVIYLKKPFEPAP